MSRVVRCLAVVALCCGLGCRSQRAKLERLVPDDALGLISIDVRTVLGADPAYGEAMGMSMADPKLAGASAAIDKRCGVDERTIDTLVVGVRAEPKSFVLALRGDELGTRETLWCIVDALMADVGLPPAMFQLSEDQGRPMVAVGDGQLIAWGVDGRTLVISDGKWATAVRERIEGRGTAAVEGKLSAMVETVYAEAPLWMAFDLSAIASTLEPTPVQGATRASATIRLHGDLSFEGRVNFDDAVAALSAERALQADLPQWAAQFPELPAAVRDSIAFTVDGTHVQVRAEIPRSSLPH